ncbi:TIGR03943 family protein [Solirubrobacter sp. CPCC 204708]|uniref:TIGR03943 family protein n=1 Tax=Solirubrobacter deserti TaxID=2282478 RepID=A0ABT4RCL9_9ACTN|nr:TIGR03943 family protein [Solirubrobacter deserti]MBE2315632.1 TIGR03943 family protein [Solirubrobacter deserti]MDA0136271.1 TIGR03943 family protein [Solirubrobacter deserti]
MSADSCGCGGPETDSETHAHHGHDHGHDHAAPAGKGWDWTRTLRALAIASWGGLFVYLWVSGRATTYIGPKTEWVVWLGAITLPLVALVYLYGSRGNGRTPTVREFGANGLLVAPILLTLMVPAPSLGAQAVSAKRTDKVAAPLQTAIEGDIRLFEIAWAKDSAEYADYNEIGAGTPVDFVAFVSKEQDANGELEVARFMVGCCAADANSFTVMVQNAPKLPVDTWVQIKGKLAGTPGQDLKVVASKVDEVAPPDNPYS